MIGMNCKHKSKISNLSDKEVDIMLNGNKGKLITISGSQAGAVETIIKLLTTKYENYRTAVITTTRQRRMDEVFGDLEEENYCFVSREEFEKGIDENQFIEYVSYAGNYYGTNKEEVFSQLKNGINVILEVNYETAHKIKEMYADAIEVGIISAETQTYPVSNVDILIINQNPEETADYLVKKIEFGG